MPAPLPPRRRLPGRAVRPRRALGCTAQASPGLVATAACCVTLAEGTSSESRLSILRSFEETVQLIAKSNRIGHVITKITKKKPGPRSGPGFEGHILCQNLPHPRGVGEHHPHALLAELQEGFEVSQVGLKLGDGERGRVPAHPGPLPQGGEGGRERGFGGAFQKRVEE